MAKEGRIPVFFVSFGVMLLLLGCTKPNPAVVHNQMAKAHELTSQAEKAASEKRSKDAIALFERALEIQRESKADSNLLGNTYCRLANMYRSEERYAEAEDRGRECVARYKESDQPNLSAIFGAYANLGGTLAKRGNLPAAISSYESAIKIYEPMPEHPSSVNSYTEPVFRSLAGIYSDQGEMEKAEEVMARYRAFSLKVKKNPFGPVRKAVAAGKTDEALAMLRNMAASAKAKKDLDIYGTSLQWLGEVSHLRREHAAAENYYRQALAVRTRYPKLGGAVDLTRAALAQLLQQTGKNEEALEQYRLALDAYNASWEAWRAALKGPMPSKLKPSDVPLDGQFRLALPMLVGMHPNESFLLMLFNNCAALFKSANQPEAAAEILKGVGRVRGAAPEERGRDEPKHDGGGVRQEGDKFIITIPIGGSASRSEEVADKSGLLLRAPLGFKLANRQKRPNGESILEFIREGDKLWPNKEIVSASTIRKRVSQLNMRSVVDAQKRQFEKDGCAIEIVDPLDKTGLSFLFSYHCEFQKPLGKRTGHIRIIDGDAATIYMLLWEFNSDVESSQKNSKAIEWLRDQQSCSITDGKDCI